MDATPKSLQQPWALKLASHGFIFAWAIVAAFPLFWVAVMSFKSPVDAFAESAVDVFMGPQTIAMGEGVSSFGIVVFLLSLVSVYYITRHFLVSTLKRVIAQFGYAPLVWVLGIAVYSLLSVAVVFQLLPSIVHLIDPFLGPLGSPVIGLTWQHYYAVWVDNQFYHEFLNSLMVTAGVLTISLTVGTLAGYGLARSGSNLAFWLLVLALIFRALPHSVLVTGYLPVFINSAEILRPIFGDAAPTLYGQPLAVIFALVAINQPFTIWMLRSFFMNVPHELDEAARVDGCNHFQAFWYVVMPVMWPGIITTGLFSFLLAYNDFLVTSLLLDGSNMTMVPAIAGYFNRETTTTDQVEAIAAAVSITAPLFVLVMVFQRQIVSGLTAGAVKG